MKEFILYCSVHLKGFFGWMSIIFFIFTFLPLAGYAATHEDKEKEMEPAAYKAWADGTIEAGLWMFGCFVAMLFFYCMCEGRGN